MTTVAKGRATLDDLMRTEGKAELIGGRIVKYMASGQVPSEVAFQIAMLLQHRATREGAKAYADGIGYAIPELSSGRESFSPDASYYTGPMRGSMKFIPDPPALAVEVRSEGDYGSAAEVEMAAKRADYFEAGTLVVWDVDCEDLVIRSHRSDDPANPVEFRPGDTAHAEPALPGWNVPVDLIFI